MQHIENIFWTNANKIILSTREEHLHNRNVITLLQNATSLIRNLTIKDLATSNCLTWNERMKSLKSICLKKRIKGKLSYNYGGVEAV